MYKVINLCDNNCVWYGELEESEYKIIKKKESREKAIIIK
jgi:hypothetical protein